MQNISNTVSKWNLKFLTRLFVVIGLCLAVYSGYTGYTELFLSDERRFWSAIENSMSTSSVTRTLRSGGTGNQVVQKQQMLFDGEPRIVSQVDFEQRGAVSNTNVVTEGIAFTDAQYSRYTRFTTDQTQQDGSMTQIDDLLNKWEVFQSTTPDEVELSRQNLVGEMVTLAVFGNYETGFKQSTIAALKSSGAYDVNFEGIETRDFNGESARIYPVRVLLRPFAEQLTAAFLEAGYGSFPPLDPEGFDPNADLQTSIAVSDRTGAIVGVNYGTRQEEYSGYGIQKQVERPDVTYSNGELEQRVQEAIGGVL